MSRRLAGATCSRRKSQRGTVLAEFAIASAVTLTLIFGVIDFGRAVYTYHLVSDGARMATRYAIVNGVASCAGGTPDPLLAYVNAESPGITAASLSVTTTCPGQNTGCTSMASPYNGSGCLVKVTVSYSFHFAVPIVSQLVLPMSSTSQMVISQ